MNESIVNTLIAHIKCGVCNSVYNTFNIKILGHEDEMWFIRAICPECKTKALVAAVIREKDIESITDLTEVEYEKFKDMEPVRPDDVLDIQQFLSTFTGNVSEMFSVNK